MEDPYISGIAIGMTILAVCISILWVVYDMAKRETKKCVRENFKREY